MTRTLAGLAGVAAILLAAPVAALAQAAYPAPSPPRFYVDLNVVGVDDALTGDVAFASRFLSFGEVGGAEAAYPNPSRRRPALLGDLGGGVMLTPWLGLGMGYSRATYDSAVGLDVTLAHPAFLDAEVTAAGVTGRELSRRESALHLTARLSALRTERFEIHVFGGPTLMWYSAEMVGAATYTQVADASSPAQTVTLTGFVGETVRDRALGVSVGADVTWFMTRGLGIAVGTRLDHAIITLEREPLSGLRQQIRIGRALGFIGLRARFGR